MSNSTLNYAWRVARFLAWSLPVSYLRRVPRREWAWIDLLKVAIEYEPMLAVPVVDLADLYPDIYETPIVASRPGFASAKASEIITLAWLASYLKPRLLVEIGTQRGGTTLLLIQNAGPEARVVTLDVLSPAEHPEIGCAFRGTPWEKQIELLCGDSRTFDWSPWQGQADLVYVDGCHEYECVWADTKTALGLLSNQGVIVWHDFPSANGVRRCLMELASSQRGVYNLRGTRLAVCDPHRASILVRPHWAMARIEKAEPGERRRLG